LLVAACVVPSAPSFVTLMKEAPGSSETSVLTRATQRNNPEDTILQEIVHLNLDNYVLSAYYCRKYYKNGRTCIYIHENLNSEIINLDKYCHDKDIEACAISLYTTSGKISAITIYRSPASNYELFLNKIELILQKNL
jgi:hypothetical protein